MKQSLVREAAALILSAIGICLIATASARAQPFSSGLYKTSAEAQSAADSAKSEIEAKDACMSDAYKENEDNNKEWSQKNKRLAELYREKKKVLEELNAGYFCSQCGRAASEIEKATQRSFQEHLTDVNGHPVPAPASLIQQKTEEYNRKIAYAKKEVESHRNTWMKLNQRYSACSSEKNEASWKQRVALADVEALKAAEAYQAWQEKVKKEREAREAARKAAEEKKRLEQERIAEERKRREEERKAKTEAEIERIRQESERRRAELVEQRKQLEEQVNQLLESLRKSEADADSALNTSDTGSANGTDSDASSAANETISSAERVLNQVIPSNWSVETVPSSDGGGSDSDASSSSLFDRGIKAIEEQADQFKNSPITGPLIRYGVGKAGDGIQEGAEGAVKTIADGLGFSEAGSVFGGDIAGWGLNGFYGALTPRGQKVLSIIGYKPADDSPPPVYTSLDEYEQRQSELERSTLSDLMRKISVSPVKNIQTIWEHGKKTTGEWMDHIYRGMRFVVGGEESNQ